MAEGRLFILHTGPVTVEPLKKVAQEIIPGVDVVNVVDDSLLREAMAAGGLTKGVIKRLCQYMIIGEEMGVDVILNACSSVGEAADIAKQLVRVPVVKIDESMAGTAVATGSRIGVVATVKTTLDPTVRLIERKAVEAGKQVTIRRALCSEAFECVLRGDGARHDALVLEEVKKLSGECDVIVLAQVSMARLVPSIPADVKTPVLSSPRLGMQEVKAVFESLKLA